MDYRGELREVRGDAVGGTEPSSELLGSSGSAFEQHCGGAPGAGGAGGGLCSRQLSSVHLTPFLTSFPPRAPSSVFLPHHPVFQPAGEQLRATRVVYTFLGIVLIYICYAC